MEVTILSRNTETDREIVHFSWEMTAEQLYKLNEFANSLVEVI